MYLPRSNALRVSHRTWTGPRTRRVCWGRSRRHGRAVSEAAVAGTRACTAIARCQKVRLTGPLLTCIVAWYRSSDRQARAGARTHMYVRIWVERET